MKSEQWSEVIQTNLNSNFLIIKSLLPNMLSNKYENYWCIFNSWTTGNPGQANYAASKSGLVGLYKSFFEVAEEISMLTQYPQDLYQLQ